MHDRDLVAVLQVIVPEKKRSKRGDDDDESDNTLTFTLKGLCMVLCYA